MKPDDHRPMATALTGLGLVLCWFQLQTLSKLGAVMPPGRFRSLGALLAMVRGQGVVFDLKETA